MIHIDDLMLIGIIGAPNKGKSTLFSALTSVEADIADYPFTTIDPNIGVAYVTKECPEKKLQVKCNARNSLCIDGTRMIPVNIIDVAGLVENAHLGKGMGNQFLNDLSAADAFMLVVDASGRTDSGGNRAENADPSDDVGMVINELEAWLAGIIKKHMNTLSKSKDGISALENVLAGLRIKKEDIEYAIGKSALTSTNINWNDNDIALFAGAILKKAKPIAVIANKMDAPNATKNIEALRLKFPDLRIFEASAAIELALVKARTSHMIDYVQGSGTFNIINEHISEEQRKGLEYMRNFISSHKFGTGVQNAINSIVFEMLGNIVVYPVEDEHKYTDHFGNVLPDAILLKKGSKAVDLASAIHTELGAKMIYAVDAVKKTRIGKDYVLNDGDIIKIVSAAAGP